jgi:hypothetical protein
MTEKIIVIASPPMAGVAIPYIQYNVLLLQFINKNTRLPRLNAKAFRLAMTKV